MPPITIPMGFALSMRNAMPSVIRDFISEHLGINRLIVEKLLFADSDLGLFLRAPICAFVSLSYRCLSCFPSFPEPSVAVSAQSGLLFFAGCAPRRHRFDEGILLASGVRRATSG